MAHSVAVPTVESAPVAYNPAAINWNYVILLSFVAAFGGLLFGYDTAVVSGAIGYLQTHFGLSAGMKGWAASSAIIGCIFGAGFAGMANDALGRKKVLIICALLFAASSIGTAIPKTLSQFVWMRFLAGVAIGAVSVTSPMYIAEISPRSVRGRLVSLYQLAIVTGILVVFFVNTLIQQRGDESWNTVTGWRYMFGAGTLPAVVFMLLVFLVPESPRWLARAGRRDEAYKILERVAGSENATREMAEIETSLSQERGTLGELLSSGYRTALIIGIILAVLQQFSGINAIMYYAPEIFKSLGAAADSAFVQTVSVGAVNLFFTLVAVYWVDQLGRKALLLGGTAIQVLSLAIVGYLFKTNGSPALLLTFILVYVAAFAAAMGPVVWIIISEIFPTKTRGIAVSIATLALWVACYIVSQTFPILVEKIGSGNTFWFYALCSAISFLFVWRFVPETKGRTLEEIEKSWGQ